MVRGGEDDQNRHLGRNDGALREKRRKLLHAALNPEDFELALPDFYLGLGRICAHTERPLSENATNAAEAASSCTTGASLIESPTL